MYTLPYDLSESKRRLSRLTFSVVIEVLDDSFDLEVAQKEVAKQLLNLKCNFFL